MLECQMYHSLSLFRMFPSVHSEVAVGCFRPVVSMHVPWSSRNVWGRYTTTLPKCLQRHQVRRLISPVANLPAFPNILQSNCIKFLDDAASSIWISSRLILFQPGCPLQGFMLFFQLTYIYIIKIIYIIIYNYIYLYIIIYILYIYIWWYSYIVGWFQTFADLTWYMKVELCWYAVYNHVH